MNPTFNRYIGIDYSGAETATSGLKGLCIYSADRLKDPSEVAASPALRRNWTRKAVAEWLVEQLSESPPTIVGIDHCFSFPAQYFQKYELPRNWAAFLGDFREHWPTDSNSTYVDFVRDGICGDASTRSGNSRWRRMTEVRVGAKSAFHFDVPGSVAKSTHAGLPWLLFLRNRTESHVHFWPFDGWNVPPGRSVIAEVYPSLWKHSFPAHGRNAHQRDAYSVAQWLRRSDLDGSLERFFSPDLEDHERELAEIEGWILGVA